MLTEIVIILLLILANGFFAGAEFAIISARRGRLEQRAESGGRAAKWALGLSRDPDRFLPTVQVGMTLVSAFAAAYGGQQFVEHLSEAYASWPYQFLKDHADGLALGTFVVCFTYISLIIGELVPKRASLYHAEGFAILAAPVMHFLSVMAGPLVRLMGISSDAVLWLLRLQAKAEPTVSTDDIEHMIDTATAEGVVDSVEQKLALGALRLGERTVRDVMRPRIDLDAMDVATPPDEVLGTIAMAGFSRVPVYENDLDHILGFVHIKDVLLQLHLGWTPDLRKLLHPAVIVPESMRLDRLLELFQEKHNQLAIVLNEYGGTEGMVTLEDVVEEIVGEIRDEHRLDEQQAFVHRDDGSWLIDGGVSIADFVERLDVKDDQMLEERSFSTLGGLILEHLGRIPSIGDEIAWNGYVLQVVDMDGQRIDRIQVTPTLEAP